MAEVTRERLVGALRKADAAGDTAAAKAIARRIKSMEAPKPEKSLLDKAGDVFGAVNQGLTFGFADEAISALSAPYSAYKNDTGLVEAYRQSQEAQKQGREQFREESPWLSAGAEMAGAIPTGIAGANALLAKTALGSAAPLTQAAGLGALEGGAYGVGAADEGERMEGGAKGAAIGAIAGPVATKGLDLIGKAGAKILHGAGARLTDTPRIEAERGIRRGLLREFDSTEDAVSRYKSGSGDGALVDVSDSILDTAKSAMRKPDSNARKIIGQAMDRRQAGQQGRLLSTIGDDLGIADNRQGREMMAQIAKQRSAQAAPLYEKAYEQWVPVSGKMFDLMDRPALKTAVKKANNLLKEEGIDPQTLFRGQERSINQGVLSEGGSIQGVNTRYVDYLKRALDDQYTALKVKSPQRAKAVLNTKKELLSEIDDRVPEYAQARQLWSDSKTLEESRELGGSIFSRKEDLSDIEDRVAGMTDSEKMMFKSGVMEAVQDKIESAGETQNAVGRLLRTTDMKKRLRNAFDSDEQFDAFVARAEQEDTFSRNRNFLNTRGGSQTDLLATGEGVLSDAVTSDGPWQASLKAAQKFLGNEASPATKEEFARIATDNSITEGQLRAMLTAKDPVGALEKLELPQSVKVRLSGLLGLEAGVLAESQ